MAPTTASAERVDTHARHPARPQLLDKAELIRGQNHEDAGRLGELDQPTQRVYHPRRSCIGLM
ncbi:MAG: hypothetical protein F4087_14410 [Gemmatimonadetes bacterium]|nr:hypothetical protein [Gemmatimonadota bacterium]